MGLLDHRRQWQFSLNATDKQCFEAFTHAMTKTGAKFFAAKWGVEQDTASINSEEQPWPARVATYQGRAGVNKVLSSVGKDDMEQAMIGSQIIFAVNPKASGGKTECTMWLSHYKTLYFGLGGIAGADCFRSYMHDVEKQLRALDPALTVSKG